MAAYKTKKRWKSILCGILVVATIIGACAGIAAIAKKDTKTISSWAFERGGVNSETGDYVKSDTSVYTPELIECKGLEITPDFDSTVKYQIFWYNEDAMYIGCTDKTTTSAEVFKNAVPTLAVFARIVIYPCDDAGKDIKDAIKFYEVRQHVRSLEITVSKDQSYEPANLYDIAISNPIESPEESLSKGTYFLEGYHYVGFDENNLAYDSYNSTYVHKHVSGNLAVIKTDCNVVKEYIFKYKNVESSFVQHVFFFDSTGTLTSASDIVRITPSSDGVYRVSIPTSATYMLLNVMDTENSFGIYEYIPRNAITEKLY